MRDVEEEIVSMAEEVNLEQFSEDLDSLKDFYPDVDDAVKFRPNYITYNIEVAREEDVFSYENSEPNPQTSNIDRNSGSIFF